MYPNDILIDSVMEWVNNLDYEYMLLHVMVCYGLYYSENLRWIVEYFSPVRKKGRSKAVWLVGGILAAIEIGRFYPHFGHDGELLDKIFSVIHSYLVIQVFVEPIVMFVHKWVDKFRKTTHMDD